MTHIKLRAILVLSPIALAACAETPGEITRDTEPFSGIAESATISALGNEPFWSVSIEPDADSGGESFTATYTAPENIDGSAFRVTRFAGNNGLGLSGTLDGQPVSLALTPGACSDTMSDRSYPYTATLAVGNRTLYGCAYTSDEPYQGEESL